MFNLENVTCVRKLSISQLANIIQNDTIDFLVGETWGYKINLVNKCGTASLGYFKNRAATGDLLQHYKGLIIPGDILLSDKNPRGNVTKTHEGALLSRVFW